MIQPDSYVRSLLKRSPGERVTARGWVKTRRDSKNVHFIQLNDGSSPVDLQIVLDSGVVAGRRDRQDHYRRLHQRGGRAGGVDGKRAVSGVKGAGADHTRHGGRGALPAAKEEAHTGDAAGTGASADALQHLRRGFPGAQRTGGGDPQVFPGSGLPVRAYAGDLGIGCRGRGQHVPGDDARSGMAGAERQGAGLHAGFLRQTHLPDGQRAAGSGDFCARLR